MEKKEREKRKSLKKLPPLRKEKKESPHPPGERRKKEINKERKERGSPFSRQNKKKGGSPPEKAPWKTEKDKRPPSPLGIRKGRRRETQAMRRARRGRGKRGKAFRTRHPEPRRREKGIQKRETKKAFREREGTKIKGAKIQGSSGGDRMGSSACAPAPASISPRLAAAADDGSASPYVSSGHQEASAWVAARLHGEDFAKGTGEKGKKEKASPEAWGSGCMKIRGALFPHHIIARQAARVKGETPKRTSLGARGSAPPRKPRTPS